MNEHRNRVPKKKQVTIRTTVSEEFKKQFLEAAEQLGVGYSESEMLRFLALNFIIEQRKIKLAEQLKKIEEEGKNE